MASPLATLACPLVRLWLGRSPAKAGRCTSVSRCGLDPHRRLALGSLTCDELGAVMQAVVAFFVRLMTRSTVARPNAAFVLKCAADFERGEQSMNKWPLNNQPRSPSASAFLHSLLALLLMLVLSTAARAGSRVALVIGNSAYQHTGKLENPKNDATDMAAVLTTYGFQVITGFDLNKTSLERKIRDFSVALRGAEVGLFFYAGHGLQVSGQNYIIPVDAELASELSLDFETVSLSLVHRIMERETQTNIVFLDACRDNPLARNLARAMGTRSTAVGRGLAAVELGVGTLISFSTQPGNVALDGTGRNSPFAGALVKHISASNNDLSALLINVRNDVMRETQRKQVPWEHSALTGQFYFKLQPGSTPISSAPSAGTPSEAGYAWNLAKETNSVSVLEAFISRYGDTFYAVLARHRIEDLKAAEAKRKEEAERQRLAKLREEQERRKAAEETETAAQRQQLSALGGFTVDRSTEITSNYMIAADVTSDLQACISVCIRKPGCKAVSFTATPRADPNCFLYSEFRGTNHTWFTRPNADFDTAIKR